MADSPRRQVPRWVRVQDRLTGIVLGSAGLCLPLLLGSAVVWLFAQAASQPGHGHWWRALAWVRGSLTIGLMSLLAATPWAAIGALLPHSERTRRWVRIGASLPLSVPAFLFLHLGSAWVGQSAGLPPQHPAWAVLALGWAMVAPLTVRFWTAIGRSDSRPWSEAATAMGAYRKQILSTIVLPASGLGLVAGFLRALARACGETMAVLLVSGDYSGPWGGASGAATAGAALVLDLPEAMSGTDLWRDLMRCALILSLWAVSLHALAGSLERRSDRGLS